jgi:hypothetical protein
VVDSLDPRRVSRAMQFMDIGVEYDQDHEVWWAFVFNLVSEDEFSYSVEFGVPEAPKTCNLGKLYSNVT